MKEAAWGQTPLIFAAALDRVEAVETLLARGADPGVTASVVDLVEDARLARAARDTPALPAGEVRDRGRPSDLQPGRGGGAGGPDPLSIRRRARA